MPYFVSRVDVIRKRERRAHEELREKLRPVARKCHESALAQAALRLQGCPPEKLWREDEVLPDLPEGIKRRPLPQRTPCRWGTILSEDSITNRCALHLKSERIRDRKIEWDDRYVWRDQDGKWVTEYKQAYEKEFHTYEKEIYRRIMYEFPSYLLGLNATS